MENISERVQSIIKIEGISTRALEQKIGCSNGVLSKWILKNTDIGSNWLSKIIEAFPQYNAAWILTGNGEPKLRDQIVDSENACQVKSCNILQMVERKDQKIIEMSEEIGRLKAENSAFKKYKSLSDYNNVAEPE